MTYAAKYLNKTVLVKIDRPLGSKHPEHGFVYTLNYGYIPGTKAPDGEEIDAYILGVLEPLTQFVGHCIAIIHRKNDNDDKLIITADNTTYTDQQIKNLTNFQEKFFSSEIIRKI